MVGVVAPGSTAEPDIGGITSKQAGQVANVEVGREGGAGGSIGERQLSYSIGVVHNDIDGVAAGEVHRAGGRVTEIVGAIDVEGRAHGQRRRR